MDLDIEKVKKAITNNNIDVVALRKHTKASELYIEVKFLYPDGYSWEGYVPYYYRRTALFIEDEKELAGYLEGLYPNFSKSRVADFVQHTTLFANTGMTGKLVTKPFLDKLLNMRWNSVKYDFPNNPNWARRIQDIKELGFTLATDTNMRVKNKQENDTHIMLVPIPQGNSSGYETFSKNFRDKVLKILGYVNAYDLSSSNRSGLLPDHKFPEIRWDDKTKEENAETMNDSEIRTKFQLLDNQRNQQKREVCRACFQTGKRGVLFGLQYYYAGDENWPADTPRIGKEAEKGCVGCGWYDIDTWRKELNKKCLRK